MRNMTEDELTEIVLEGYKKTTNPRVRKIVLSLITHLHAFVKDVQLTEPEWMEGIKYITAAGQISDDKRQEVILFSDLLGVSALVNLISAKVPNGATESTVIGPFYIEGAPAMKWGESIAKREGGDPMIIRGKVTGMSGEPVPNARIDVWQTDANSMYDVQDPEAPENNLRGYYMTNDKGEYLIKTIRPVAYTIPVDGPAGDLVRAGNRHPWRPAHVHAIVTAKNYNPLTTHLFDSIDQYLDSDVVFAVKPSLIREIKPNNSKQDAEKFGMPTPFLELNTDFVLSPSSERAA